MKYESLFSLWQRGGTLLAGVPLVPNQPAAEKPAAEPVDLERIRASLTWENIAQWFVEYGPKLLAIALGMWLLQRVLHYGADRMVRVMDLATSRAGGNNRENRATTLSAVLRSVATSVVVVGGILMALQVMRIPITPLLGGVAVVGLAVAFGAQNLIKDYFTGTMILLEDQYGVGDVVKIGDVSGQVERVTLRITVLRDLEGTAHFIPHGQVTVVSNRSHYWSRTVLDIGVAYGENIDRVIDALVELGREARNDETLGPLILDEPEMMGVDQLGDSAVVVRMALRTKPMQQWTVKRAMLRRIKNRFDELGIEIPFPQRTLHVRQQPKEPEA